jgi:hypothetical protein
MVVHRFHRVAQIQSVEIFHLCFIYVHLWRI